MLQCSVTLYCLQEFGQMPDPTLRSSVIILCRRLQVLFFRFVMGIGICPLTGTTSVEHMAADLRAREVPLTEEDARRIDAMLLPA